jgi:hypothetical protein
MILIATESRRSGVLLPNVTRPPAAAGQQLDVGPSSDVNLASHRGHRFLLPQGPTCAALHGPFPAAW